MQADATRRHPATDRVRWGKRRPADTQVKPSPTANEAVVESAFELHFCCICGALLAGDLEDEINGEGWGQRHSLMWRDCCETYCHTRNRSPQPSLSGGSKPSGWSRGTAMETNELDGRRASLVRPPTRTGAVGVRALSLDRQRVDRDRFAVGVTGRNEHTVYVEADRLVGPDGVLAVLDPATRWSREDRLGRLDQTPAARRLPPSVVGRFFVFSGAKHQRLVGAGEAARRL